MRPNILIYLSDQEQADVLAAGHPCITPNADRLAAGGMRFGRAYCPTAHCCPSRATFMTGLYPSRHGIYNNVNTPTAINKSLPPGIVTFSESLRDAGYNLAYAGKWHVTATENPSDRGWEELEITGAKTAGKPAIQKPPPNSRWRNYSRSDSSESTRGPGEILRPGWGKRFQYRTLPDEGPKAYEGTNDFKVVRSAVEALARLAKQDAPWCLFVGPHGPHDPFNVPKKFVDMYDLKDVPLPASFSDTLEDKPRIYQRMRTQYWDQLGEQESRETVRHYWALCSMVDALFGEVLDALDATGQADDTLVLRMSDHGEYAGAHGLWCKGVPAFREAYHIPVIARWPGKTPPGSEIDVPITLADFAPTILELAGLDSPDNLTGRSLVPLLRGEPAPADWPDTVFTQFNGVELFYTQRSVITRDWKYVYNGFDFDELYDLRSDPHEMTNLAGDPAHAETMRELVRRMWRFADREDDRLIFNGYATVAMAPWGPGDALGTD